MNTAVQASTDLFPLGTSSPTLSAKTQFITINGIKFAYRRLGKTTGVPLVMLMHFRGNMDFWDMNLIDPLAAVRPIIMLDNSGIGESNGVVPLTIKDWAQNAISILRALKVSEVDVLGFSMGGFVAQMFALEAPDLVRKLVLAGTMASGGPKSVAGDRASSKALGTAESDAEAKAAFAATMFPATEEGRSAAEGYWARLLKRNAQLKAVDLERTRRQLQTFKHWAEVHPENSWDRLGELKMPVFVANGDYDLLIPTVNSWHLMEGIPNAHLHIYPQAGHGFLFQFASLFATHVNIFLGDAERSPKGPKL